jgi:hypothetical protein
LPTGNGSAASPWNLATALAHPAVVQPGDTIWLRGGTYSVGGLTSRLTGTILAPIIVRQYPGERAIIDGHITVNGSYTWFWGFEILNSNLADTFHDNMDVQAPGIRLINLITHDASGSGVGLWSSSPDAVMYGCLSYNNGRLPAPAPPGHGLYTQNSTGFKRIYDNIFFNSYGYNVHAYSSSGGQLNNFDYQGNISFNAGQYGIRGGQEYLIGGALPVNNLVFKNNYAYRAAPGEAAQTQLGLEPSVISSGGIITGNYLQGSVMLIGWSSGTFTGNTAVNAQFEVLWLKTPSAANFANFTWNNNIYRKSGTAVFYTEVAGVGSNNTFAQWRTLTGLDGASDFQNVAATGQHIFVRPNQYERGRAHVAVYNWDGAATATVDLSRVLQSGDEFEVREVQNYFGTPVISGTYAGGTVSIPMTAVTAPPPLGRTNVPARSTGTTFHAFVVQQK